MEATSATTTVAADTQAHTTTADPMHQYAVYPQQVPMQPPQQQLVNPVASQALSVGVLGLIVVSTGTMGANLRKVEEGEMSMGEAVSNSLAKGAAGGIAAATATAASATLTSGGLAGLAVTLATATGVSYLLSK